MKNKLTLFIFLAAFILLNINILYAIENTKNNLTNYFRIHIVANSDTINDQMLKLKITDSITKYIKSITNGITEKEEYIKTIQNNIPSILNIANQIQKGNGYNYPLTIHIGNIKYDHKTYNRIQMTKGTYNSLRIVIGEGLGNNWWSLLYPSMPENMTVENAIVNEDVEFKSIILEWINELFSE